MIKLVNVTQLGSDKGNNRSTKKFILKEINLSVNEGEFVYITGPSGAGKTSLLKLLYKEQSADSGVIRVGTIDVKNLKKSEIPFLRRQIGVVFQNFRLLPQMNVEENLIYALDIVGTPPKEINKKVTHVLRIVGLSEKRFATEISGGEAQRVAIARALINYPKLIIADEPTGNLDGENSSRIIRLLEQINKRGITIVMTTHNQSLIDQFPHREIKMKENRIVSDDSLQFNIK